MKLKTAIEAGPPPVHQHSGNAWCRHDRQLYASPTRLALALGAGASGDAQQHVGQRFIIVETNYRVTRLLCSSNADVQLVAACMSACTGDGQPCGAGQCVEGTPG